MRLSGFGLLSVATAAVAGCGLVAGLGSYGRADGGGGNGAGPQGGGGVGGDGGTPLLTCGDGVCLASPEDGWLGPVLVSWRDTPVDCPVLWSADERTIHADPLVHTCSGCSCPTINASCGEPMVGTHLDSSCSGDPIQSHTAPLNCQPLLPGPDLAYFLEGLPTPVNGDCGSNPVDAEVVGPMFDANAKICAPATSLAGDCPAGFECQPGVPAEYFACVWRQGEGAPECPEAYPNPQLAHLAFEDQRGCEACACGFPDAICDGAVLVYAMGGCNGTPVTLSLDGACSALAGWSAFERSQLLLPSDLTCEASGGEPTGQVDVMEPVSLCCTGQKP